MRIFIFIFSITLSLVACSMGGRSQVISRPLLKSLFFLGDTPGEIYTNKCLGKRHRKTGLCKKPLVKKTLNFCEQETFNGLKKERYILVKESDFLN